MDISFIVRFSPEAKIDYSFDLVIVTEREKFVVPIFATGKRAMIDFPDELSFGHCPVKYMTEKPIMIRNIGEKTTKWFLQLPTPFDADKKEGVLENGKHEQIIVKFYPTEEKDYRLEGIFAYDNLRSYFTVSGKSHKGNVYLSKSYIQMDDAYIGLQTQQTLQIVNKSSVKVDFQWRAFKTEKEEYDKKNKLRLQLDQEEAEEKMLLKEMAHEFTAEDYDFEEEEESDDEDKDEKALILKRQKK
jgi:hydrocephalus-inducing protein